MASKLTWNERAGEHTPRALLGTKIKRVGTLNRDGAGEWFQITNLTKHQCLSKTETVGLEPRRHKEVLS